MPHRTNLFVKQTLRKTDSVNDSIEVSGLAWVVWDDKEKSKELILELAFCWLTLSGKVKVKTSILFATV